MLDVFQRLADLGVLGMNARNAEYIMANNPREAFPSVDDKIVTKRLAQRYGIPVPELYFVVESHGSMRNLSQALENRPEFVVKPARGSGGSGILLIEDQRDGGFVTQKGRIISREDFIYHIASILSGIYSLGGIEDIAIIEALIHPDPVFDQISYQGVPDERIIVYKGVPVMAMVRLPTRASDGKANIHRGAIGAGINIGLGITLPAVHKLHIVETHPDTGQPVSGIRIPHWDRMLLLAAEAMDMTGLGYLGADFVIDRNQGPVLLELNARPGLAIQMANQSGLRTRLARIDRERPDALPSPAARVAWAKEAFA